MLSFSKFFGLLLAVAFVGSEARAESFTIPAFSGKVNNHSPVPNTAFKLEYHFSCGYQRFPGDFWAYCGGVEYVATISADGSFSVPKISIKIEMDPEDRIYTPVLRTSASLSVPPEASGYPFGNEIGGMLGLFDFKSKWNPSKEELARTFSIFQINEQKILFDLKAGTDPLAWSSNIGRDLRATFNFDFSNGKAEEKFFERDPRTAFFNRNSFDHSDWSQIPQQLVMVAGLWEANAPVKVVVDGMDDKQFESTFPFSSVLPEKTRTIEVDDSKYEDPSDLRNFNGAWKGGYVSLNFGYKGKLDPISRVNYFTANLSCEAGKLVGEFIFRDSQNEPGNELLRVPVSGSCDGETAVMEFSLKLKSGEAIDLTARVTKILAVKKEGHLMSVMSSGDVVDFEKRSGSEVSSQMALRDKAGEEQGTIWLSRN